MGRILTNAKGLERTFNMPDHVDWRAMAHMPFETRLAALKESSKQWRHYWSGVHAVWPCPYHCTMATETEVAYHARIAFICKHVNNEPIDHHPGIVVTPEEFFLCRTCWKLIERKKFDFGTEVVLGCMDCVQDRIEILKKTNPELVRDVISEEA